MTTTTTPRIPMLPLEDLWVLVDTINAMARPEYEAAGPEDRHHWAHPYLVALEALRSQATAHIAKY